MPRHRAGFCTIADETVEDISGETYGALKALCEKCVASEIAAWKARAK